LNVPPAVLVTGAAGLIGEEVCRQLLVAGRRVIATDARQPPRHQRGEPDVHEVDVRDLDALERACRGETLDAVVHCGGFSGAMVKADSSLDLVDVNVAGTMTVLELARRLGARRFVYASTASAYGSTGPGPVTEDHPLAPGSMYAATKAASELLAAAFADQHALEVVSLRISWVYGPHRVTDCVIRTMLTDALASVATRMSFGADFPRQYMHVEDAARALVLAVDAHPLSHGTYNVSGGDIRTLEEIAQVVRTTVPEADIELRPGPDPGDVVQGPLDISRAELELGFTPTIDLAAGIAAYAAHLSALEPSTVHANTAHRHAEVNP
jgi:UDP-glucuronate 4-epimerase